MKKFVHDMSLIAMGYGAALISIYYKWSGDDLWFGVGSVVIGMFVSAITEEPNVVETKKEK